MVEARFSELLASLNHTDLKIQSLSLRGDPRSLITQYASEIKADLVVIGMRGVTAASRIVSAMIGSVTEHVMRSSPCPTGAYPFWGRNELKMMLASVVACL